MPRPEAWNVLARAPTCDALMYRAKAAGKDRLVYENAAAAPG